MQETTTLKLRVLVEAQGNCVDAFEPYVHLVTPQRAAARVASGDEIVSSLIPPAGATRAEVEADVRSTAARAASKWDAVCMTQAGAEPMHPAWALYWAVSALADDGYTVEHRAPAVIDAPRRQLPIPAAA